MRSKETSIQKQQQPWNLQAVDVLTEGNSFRELFRGKLKQYSVLTVADSWLSKSEVPFGLVVIHQDYVI